MMGLRSNSASPGAEARGDDQAARLRELMERLQQAQKARPVEVPVPKAVAEPAPNIADSGDAVATPPLAARCAPIIAVASGKGGVGKTNVSVNLSIALAQRGLKVTLLDADLGVANADLLCGINPSMRVEHALAKRECWLEDLAIDVPGGFKLIPGSVGVSRAADLGLADRQRLIHSFTRLGERNDALVVDTGAGVGSIVTTFVAAADLALIVVTPEPTSIADAYALIKCVRAIDTGNSGVKSSPTIQDTNIQLVINQAASDAEAIDVAQRIAGACERFLRCRIGFAGHIAQDPRVREAVKARNPVLVGWPTTKASRDLSSLGARVAEHLGLACSPAELRALVGASGARPREGVLKRLLALTLGR